METWKEIPGYPGYEVSDHGRVRSYKKHLGGVRWVIEKTPQRILKPSTGKGNEYPSLAISDSSGASRRWRVHQLVLLAFIGPPPDGMETCHEDGDSANNHLSNLRYDTHVGNCADMPAHQAARAKSRLTESQVVYIRTSVYEKTATPADLMAEFGVSNITIVKIVRGRTYKWAGGPITTTSLRKYNHNPDDGFRGVSQVASGKYEARIWIGGRGGYPHCIGTFSNPEKAARAYDKRAKELHGVFAALNFPEVRQAG